MEEFKIKNGTIFLKGFYKDIYVDDIYLSKTAEGDFPIKLEIPLSEISYIDVDTKEDRMKLSADRQYHIVFNSETSIRSAHIDIKFAIDKEVARLSKKARRIIMMNNVQLGFTELDLTYLDLKEVNISKYYNLRKFTCAQNEIKEIQTEYNPKLEYIDCWGNKIESLNITSNLREVYCENNSIQELDLSNANNLRILFCGYNKLKNLDVSKVKNLYLLCCQGNLFKELDLTRNKNLKGLYCKNNLKLESIKINKDQQLHMEIDDNIEIIKI